MTLDPNRTPIRLYLVVLLIIIAAAFAMTGCATVPAPRTAQDGVAYGYAALSAARVEAASLLDKGTITVNQAKEAQKIANAARLALDEASSLLARGQPDLSAGALAAATALLGQLNGLLKNRE